MVFSPSRNAKTTAILAELSIAAADSAAGFDRPPPTLVLTGFPGVSRIPHFERQSRAETGGGYSGVGTVLFNMVVNPATGRLYVSNTEAQNEVRFEGPGIFGGSTVRGHMHESRITVIDGGAVDPRHLNKHIDYDACCDATPNDENERSLAQPLQMAVTADGTTLYVAAFGSAKIGVFQTATLEDDSFVPDAGDHIELTGGGPTGVVVDEARGRLYVLTRFDNTVSAVDLASRREIVRRPLYNPEPAHVVAGRPFLYDARLSSGNGRGVAVTAGGQQGKVPHLRNQYQKVGMFGTPNVPGLFVPHLDTSHQGDQLRGFGFLHSGGVDTVFRFVGAVAFSDALFPNGFPFGPEGDSLRRDMEAFMLAFDSNQAPVVGQQVTLTKSNGAAVSSRIDLLISRARTETSIVLEPHAPECELVVTTRASGVERGYLYLDGPGVFRPSEHGEPDLTDAVLRVLAQHGALTYTCVPLGSGLRVALDADLDGCYNVTEVKSGSDPRDPSSISPECGAP